MQIIIKTVTKGYDTRNNLENLITYMLSDKCESRPCCFDYFNAGSIIAYEEMAEFQNNYGKTKNRFTRHFIVNFKDAFCIDTETAVKLAYKLALFYSSKYQIIFAVYEEKKHIHVHFVLSTVNFADQTKFPEDFFEIAKFRECVECVVNDYEDNLNRY